MSAFSLRDRISEKRESARVIDSEIDMEIEIIHILFCYEVARLPANDIQGLAAVSSLTLR